MPTYHYRCKKCTHEFEEFQKMSDDSFTLCPECATNNLSRIIGSGAGFLLKGNGYYSTDYKKTEPKENSSKKTEQTKSSSTPEVKPDTTSKEANVNNTQK